MRLALIFLLLINLACASKSRSVAQVSEPSGPVSDYSSVTTGDSSSSVSPNHGSCKVLAGGGVGGGNPDKDSTENKVTPQNGLSGTNSGTASTGGVIYIQNTLDNANSLENQKISSRADLLKDERKRQELENEVRLLEKVEEGRLEDERARENARCSKGRLQKQPKSPNH